MKIIVCTTLREFRGNDNDEIQRKFLESLENQDYKNFDLIVTMFKEKNVESEVKKFNLNSVFFREEIGEKYRYSHTKVLLNGIKYALANFNEFIVLWTTSDVIYPKNFFSIILERYNKNLIGTSHPHIVYPSILDFLEGKRSKESLHEGFDLIYFDSIFLSNKLVLDSIENYTFYDWGLFEHFLIALNELNKTASMINLYYDVKVSKIENNRRLTRETKEFLENSWKNNFKILNNFLYKNNIKTNYFSLVYCHSRFKFKTNKIKFYHYIKFRKDFMKYCFKSCYRSVKKLSFLKFNKK